MKVLIPIFFLSLILVSCKKGSDDPFFTINSRKSRLTGSWTAVSGNGTRDYNSGLGEAHPSNYTEDFSYFDFVNDVTRTQAGTEINYSHFLAIRYTFNKDKSYNEYWEEEVYNPSNGTSYYRVTESSGTWSFVNGKKDVQLTIETETIAQDCTGCDTTTTNYTSDNKPTKTLELSRLAQREINTSLELDNSQGNATDITTWNLRLIKD